MNIRTVLPFLAVGAVALAACGTEQPATEPFPTPPDPTSQTTTAPARAKTYQAGQDGAVILRNGAEIGFTVDSIARISGSQCDGAAFDGPPDAQYIEVRMTVRTHDTVPPAYESVFAPSDWKVRGDNGEVLNEAGMDWDAMMCRSVDEGDDLRNLETNSIYRYVMVLPAEGPSGTLIMDDQLDDVRFEMRY